MTYEEYSETKITIKDNGEKVNLQWILQQYDSVDFDGDSPLDWGFDPTEVSWYLNEDGSDIPMWSSH